MYVFKGRNVTSNSSVIFFEELLDRRPKRFRSNGLVMRCCNSSQYEISFGLGRSDEQV